jgi:hypothetical protein
MHFKTEPLGQSVLASRPLAFGTGTEECAGKLQQTFQEKQTGTGVPAKKQQGGSWCSLGPEQNIEGAQIWV